MGSFYKEFRHSSRTRQTAQNVKAPLPKGPFDLGNEQRGQAGRCQMTRVNKIKLKAKVAGVIRQVVCLKGGHDMDEIDTWRVAMIPDRAPREYQMSPDGNMFHEPVKLLIDYIKIVFYTGQVRYFCPVREKLFSNDQWTHLDRCDMMSETDFCRGAKRYNQESVRLSGAVIRIAEELTQHIRKAFRIKKSKVQKEVMPYMQAFARKAALKGIITSDTFVEDAAMSLAAQAEEYYAKETDAGFGILDNDEAHYSRKLHSDNFGSF